MKILIVTQVMDKDHPILGFFHRWVEEFAKNCEQVQVVCLCEGEHTLPHNVAVYSLGKEKSEASSIRYAFRLLKLSWKLKKEYDAVFVHMNPEYVLAGAVLWKMLRKEIRFWYAHGAVTLKLHAAALLADLIFTSTKDGCRISSKKVKVIGQGIDTEHFAEIDQGVDKQNVSRLVTVGRVSRSKRIETLLKAVSLLKEGSVPCRLTIVGGTSTPEEEEYLQELTAYTKQHDLSDYVVFAGPVTQERLPSILRESSVFVSDGATGSLDKALLESAACGLIVISSNQAFRNVVLPELPETVFNPQDPVGLASHIRSLADLDTSRILSTQRRLLVAPNTIAGLVKKILKTYTV